MKEGLTEKKVREISSIKGEPEWMTDFRVMSYKKFMELDNPSFGPKIDLNFDIINYYKRMNDKVEKDWSKVSCGIRDTFEISVEQIWWIRENGQAVI